MWQYLQNVFMGHRVDWPKSLPTSLTSLICSSAQDVEVTVTGRQNTTQMNTFCVVFLL
jgi:hypothetical protein